MSHLTSRQNSLFLNLENFQIRRMLALLQIPEYYGMLFKALLEVMQYQFARTCKKTISNKSQKVEQLLAKLNSDQQTYHSVHFELHLDLVKKEMDKI